MYASRLTSSCLFTILSSTHNAQLQELQGTGCRSWLSPNMCSSSWSWGSRIMFVPQLNRTICNQTKTTSSHRSVQLFLSASTFDHWVHTHPKQTDQGGKQTIQFNRTKQCRCENTCILVYPPLSSLVLIPSKVRTPYKTVICWSFFNIYSTEKSTKINIDSF